MRALRIFFCGFAFVASLLALAHHLGFDLWNCASCSLVDEMPMSSALAWGGPIVLLALTVLLYRDQKAAPYLLAGAGVASAGLVAWMFQRNTVCEVCMLVHIGVLSAALALIPRAGYAAPFLFSLAVAFSGTGGWQRLTVEQGVAMFVPRSGETVPQGKVYVLFSDPECGRCQLVEGQIAAMAAKPNVLYRWFLLPQKTYRTIRAVAMLEMARGEGAFDRLLEKIRTATPPLDDAAIKKAAAGAGLAAKADKWLTSPDEAVLNAIGDDQQTARALGIESLPALAELSPPGPDGVRMLRRVPFSAIGIQP